MWPCGSRRRRCQGIQGDRAEHTNFNHRFGDGLFADFASHDTHGFQIEAQTTGVLANQQAKPAQFGNLPVNICIESGTDAPHGFDPARRRFALAKTCRAVSQQVEFFLVRRRDWVGGAHRHTASVMFGAENSSTRPYDPSWGMQ